MVNAITDALGELVDRGTGAYDSALTHTMKSWQFAAWTTNRVLEGNVFPTWGALVDVQRTLGRSATRLARGEASLRETAGDLGGRARSAARWSRLVGNLGREIYGSATWPGERILAEHGPFKLTYIPPAADVETTRMAVFHVGGSIPYGDGIFRLTPEHNLYGRFVERGVGVYAMELNGDRYANNYGRLTMDELVHATDHLTEVAYGHHGRRLVFEGYCGHGTQALAFLCSRPEAVAERIRTVATFVSPIDGTRCERVAAPVQRAPDGLMEAQYALFDRLGGYFPGDPARIGLDMALGSMFHKTHIGYLTAGWMNAAVGGVRSREDLDASGQRDLAGAYWISPEMARRYPIPVGMARYTTELFTKGVGRDGELPWSSPEGRPLSLATLRDETDVDLIGFYGGLDVVVPDATAHCLMNVFGDRYTHIVHPNAGHISYVLSPKAWRAGANKRPLTPNPIDLLLAGEQREDARS